MHAEASTIGSSVAPAAAASPASVQFGPRLLIGILGILLAAIMSGVNNRLGNLALMDVKASLGAGADEGSWLSVIYAAGELAAMPISAWFSVTLSLRRYHMGVVAVFCALGLLMPSAQSLGWLIALRGVQGFFGGLLIPVLMAAALRFFPLSMRLYGLSLYALTATFSPNISVWLAGVWTDTFSDVRLIYLQSVPVGVLALLAVSWGIPQDPVRLERFRQMNCLGLFSGTVGLALIAVALGQGERLDWLHSPMICAALLSGSALLAIFLLSEWFHPLPFVRLQLLHRRNLGLGFFVFTCMLMVFLSGSLLPAEHLVEMWHFRTQQIAPVALWIGLPQLLVGPAVAMVLYQQWVDARKVFASGLALIAASCFLASNLTSEWMAIDFVIVQTLQMVGQPMAVIAMLFLATSVVQPMEGPSVSGIVNGLRAFGTLLGQTVVQHMVIVREKFHSHVLVDQTARSPDVGSEIGGAPDGLTSTLVEFAEQIRRQASVLAISDSYLFLGATALLLIPMALCLQYIQPPAPRH